MQDDTTKNMNADGTPMMPEETPAEGKCTAHPEMPAEGKCEAKPAETPAADPAM